jgi:hypothetical protein
MDDEMNYDFAEYNESPDYYLSCGCYSAQSDHTCAAAGGCNRCGGQDDCYCPDDSDYDSDDAEYHNGIMNAQREACEDIESFHEIMGFETPWSVYSDADKRMSQIMYARYTMAGKGNK